MATNTQKFRPKWEAIDGYTSTNLFYVCLSARVSHKKIGHDTARPRRKMFNFLRETETFLNSMLLHTQYERTFPLIGCFISSPFNGFLQTVKVLYNIFQPQQLRLLNTVRRWALHNHMIKNYSQSCIKTHLSCRMFFTDDSRGGLAHISKKKQTINV